MPLVCVKTNLPVDAIPKDFHVQLTKMLAETMGKPEERISVTVEAGKSMTRGCSFDPYCEVHMTAIGVESRDKTLPVVQQTTKFISEKTEIPPARIAMWIVSAQPHHVACNGALMG